MTSVKMTLSTSSKRESSSLLSPSPASGESESCTSVLQPLELIKSELAHGLLQFCDFTKKVSLLDVVQSSVTSVSTSVTTTDSSPTSSFLEAEHTNTKTFICQVEYIRSFLSVIKLLPKGIVAELGWKVVRECEALVKATFAQVHQASSQSTGDAHEDKGVITQLTQMLIIPAVQLTNDCLDLQSAVLLGDGNGQSFSSETPDRAEEGITGISENMRVCTCRILTESILFLLTPVGISLAKSDFWRILALCKKAWNFSVSIQKSLDSKQVELESFSLEDKSIVEKSMSEVLPTLLSKENGRSVLKFWCEMLYSVNVIPQILSEMPLESFPELYIIFTAYMQDSSFWKTETGRALTSVLIQAIRQDLRCDKPETRKRAAFVLQGITSQYSSGKPLFDKDIPEVASISLEGLNVQQYKKFWAHFFDLYDILNETQIHIIQPVLQKLNIFPELSSCEDIFTWLPTLLKKMITHDNRAVVREGLERFLQTGQFFQSDNNRAMTAYQHQAAEFLDAYILPLLRDHVGWVLNEPEDHMKTTVVFGQFLVQLYLDRELPQLDAAEKVLKFLTSSGKCMSSNTIFFFVSSLDAIFSLKCDDIIEAEDKNDNKVISKIESYLTLLSLLLSNSLTTVSKYFRELLDSSCIKILSKTTPYLKYFNQGVQLDSVMFLKLLTFMGSVSEKVIRKPEMQDQVCKFVESLNEIEPGLYTKLSTGSNLYEFAQANLSSTSILGMFRYLIASSNSGSREHEIPAIIASFAHRAANGGILKGSIPALYEFYQTCQPPGLTRIPKEYETMVRELHDKLIGPAKVSFQDFVFVISRLEVLKCIPQAFNLVKPLPPLPNTVKEDLIKMFLLRKLNALKSYEAVERLHEENEIDNVGLEKVEDIDEISKFYFAFTDTNIFADFHRYKFEIYKKIVETRPQQLEAAYVKNVLETLLDTIEKCDPRGVATGLRLANCMIKYINEMGDDKLEFLSQLEKVASISWSLVFELRKSDAFWYGIESFIDFIVSPHFLESGDLSKYAELIFEHGETIGGLSFLFVRQLIRTEFPQDMLEDVNKILVQAALAGAPIPKNNRVTFALWDYLSNESKIFSDPENFSSDNKARFLACEKLRLNIHNLISSESTNKQGEFLLYRIVTHLLQRNDEISLTRKRYFGGSATHRMKQRIFQLLLVLQPYYKYEISKIAMRKTIASLASDSPQPSVRYLGEWLVVRILERFPQLYGIFFSCLNEGVETRLGYGAFFATICLHVSKLVESSDFYDKALQSLAVLTLSQHVTVRIYAQTAFQMIYEKTVECKYENLISKYSIVSESLKGASEYVSGNCQRLLDNIEKDFYVNTFHCRTHYLHEVIFTLLPKMSGMIKDECILHPESIRDLMLLPQSDDIASNHTSLPNLQRVYFENESSAWHLKASVVADGRELGEESPNKAFVRRGAVPQSQTSDEETNYQKKITPWKLLEAEVEEYRNFNIKKQSLAEEGLIVVASLLDHLPNLGGLCRTCEIFGVNKYVVNSLKMINDQQFQSLSVSAHNWVNILEVPLRDLESFLLTYAAKGYAILGIEQANESSSLTNFDFPKKTVLLLGNEKHGIPSNLLHLVDKCIEIPQVGIIRSLNVHVTGALCIYKYASKHIL